VVLQRSWRASSAHRVKAIVLVLGPALAVLLAAIFLWLATGVGVTPIALLLGYELLFVLLPGWVAVESLVRWPGAVLTRCVLAAALGNALLAVAFAVTAALGFRGLLTAYPILALALAPVVLRRKWVSRVRVEAPERRWHWRPWIVAALCIAALVALALQSWMDPLPGSVASVSYGLDDVWNLSLAAEARHHWPLTDPTLAGVSLPYHWFAAMSAASASQVTGLSLPLVFFRLYLLPLLLLAVLGLCELGSLIARRPLAGPVAAGLALFAGEIDLDPVHGLTFGNEISNDVFGLSPTFLAGLAFFLPLLMLVVARIEAPAEAAGWRWWLVWLLLLGAAVAAKATILPVLAAGLGLWLLGLAWRFGATGVRRLLLPWLAVVAVYAVSYSLIYRGAGSSGLVLDPPGGIRQMRGLDPVTAAFHGHALAALLLWPLVVIVGLVGAYGAALIGLPWLRSRGGRIAPSQSLMLCLLVAGLVPFLLFTHPGFSQVYFSQYGVVAASAVSATGLCRLADSARGRWPAGASWALTAAGLVLIAVWIFARGSDQWRAWFPALDLAVASLAAMFIAIAFTLRRGRVAARWLWPGAIALIVVAALNTPLDVAPHLIDRVLAGQPPYVQAGKQVTPGIAQGLGWLRDHSSPDAVIAVNNYSTHRRRRHGPLPAADEYIYSALAERRVFLEGWVYANRSFQLGESAVLRGRREPFPDRRRLNDAVFKHADRRALRVLVHRYHVRYLVVDRIHGGATSRLARLAARAYSNSDIRIYAAE